MSMRELLPMEYLILWKLDKINLKGDGLVNYSKSKEIYKIWNRTKIKESITAQEEYFSSKEFVFITKIVAERIAEDNPNKYQHFFNVKHIYDMYQGTMDWDGFMENILNNKMYAEEFCYKVKYSFEYLKDIRDEVNIKFGYYFVTYDLNKEGVFSVTFKVNNKLYQAKFELFDLLFGVLSMINTKEYSKDCGICEIIHREIIHQELR